MLWTLSTSALGALRAALLRYVVGNLVVPPPAVAEERERLMAGGGAVGLVVDALGKAMAKHQPYVDWFEGGAWYRRTWGLDSCSINLEKWVEESLGEGGCTTARSRTDSVQRRLPGICMVTCPCVRRQRRLRVMLCCVVTFRVPLAVQAAGHHPEEGELGAQAQPAASGKATW